MTGTTHIFLFGLMKMYISSKLPQSGIDKYRNYSRRQKYDEFLFQADISPICKNHMNANNNLTAWAACAQPLTPMPLNFKIFMMRYERFSTHLTSDSTINR